MYKYFGSIILFFAAVNSGIGSTQFLEMAEAYKMDC